MEWKPISSLFSTENRAMSTGEKSQIKNFFSGLGSHATLCTMYTMEFIKILWSPIYSNVYTDAIIKDGGVHDTSHECDTILPQRFLFCIIN